MPAQASVKDWYTFVSGLNTEGGYFVTPDGTWKEGRNIVPQVDGSIERRNGLDFEKDRSNTIGYFPSDNNPDLAISVGKWSPTTTVDLLVVQIGTKLHFYYDTSSTISSTQLLSEINLSDYVVGITSEYSVDASYACNFAQAYGNLVVTHRSINPILLAYNSADESINGEEIKIKIRDFEGFNTFGAEPTDERTEAEWITYYSELPGNYSDGDKRALYNLKNQGWNTTQIAAYKAAYSNDLPSNTKIWFYGKDASDNFSASLLNKQEFGTGLAPKGRYIFEAFNPSRTEGAFTETNNSYYRPSVTGFFAGRIWYAGSPDPVFSSKIYFSQVLDNIEKVGDCYQINDPTSEILNDILDSDGGVLDVPEAGRIVKLIALGRGLLVFAENGIFSISGLDGIFSANNYQVEKISAVGTLFPETVVIVNNGIMFWGVDGVYAVTPQAGGLSFSVDNVSNSSIRTFYNDITFQAKTRACGAYNPTSNEIAWLYDTSTDETLNITSKKTTMLVYNVTINSWYVHDLTNDKATFPTFIFVTKPNSTAINELTVVDNDGNTLIDILNNYPPGNTIAVDSLSTTAGSYSFKVIATLFENEGAVLIFTNSPTSTTLTGSSPLGAFPSISTQLVKNGYEYAMMSDNTDNEFGISSKIIVAPVSGTTFNVIDTSESSVHHSGWGAWSFFFDNAGLRLYVSQYNRTLDRARIAYYAMSGVGSTIFSSYNVIAESTTTTVRNQYLFSDMKRSNYSTNVDGEIKNNTLMGILSVPTGSGTDLHLKTMELTDDGYPQVTTPVVHTKLISDSAYNYNALYPLTNTEILLTKQNDLYGGAAPYVYGVISIPIPGRLDTIDELDYYNQLNYNRSRTSQWLGYETGISAPAVIDKTSGATYLYADSAGVVKRKTHPFIQKVNFDLILGSSSYNADYKTIHINFADFNNTRNTDTKFIDWQSIGYTVEKEAFVLTGYHMADNGPARQATGTYLTTFAKRTETALDENGDSVNPSRINMQIRWDFTDNEVTNKWSATVNVYRPPRMYIGNPGDTYDDGYPLVISKSKIRGRGKALQFKYSSEPGYDMKLVGWTGTFVGNTNV